MLIYDNVISRTSELLTILLQNNFMALQKAKDFIQHLLEKYDEDGDGKFNYPGKCDKYDEDSYGIFRYPSKYQF